MQQRLYGKTGKSVSVIGFGGMRFPNPQDIDANARLVLHAYHSGINYFDTAPGYCGDKSEIIFGAAIKQMKPGSFYVSTKSSARDKGELRSSIERSIDRLNVDAIDFFHIWCVITLDDWAGRKEALKAAVRAKEEGLIRHLVVSSHLEGNQLASVLKDGPFEGVTLGYNVINHSFRQAALDASAEMGLGVVIMNPLGGGLIPQNQQRFAFLGKSPNTGVVQGALRFVTSSPAVTSAIVGFSSAEQIDQAVAAVEDAPRLTQQQHAELRKACDGCIPGVCTGCGYCLPCPAGIQIPGMMDAYNMKLLSKDITDAALIQRLDWQWDITPAQANDCTRCGACEDRCTQHLPIRQRLEELGKLAR
ncbi:MAG: aldo/keto reductase [Planctomycetes bacterium]|nr:aldo/keto reductase [Planctomycetota bacterium]